MKPIAKKILTALLCLAIVGAAAVGAKKLIASKKKPQKTERVDTGVLVATVSVERKKHRLDIVANGTVRPAREMTVFPEITGRLTKLHDQLVPGGLISKGDTLFRIHVRDWRLAVEESETQVDQARAKLDVERGQTEIAAREWALFEKEAGGAQVDASLALREPQMKSARVGVRAARTRLDRAKSNLSKTAVKAPFDALVRSENAEVGQLVSPGSRIASLVGTEQYWVQISLPIEQLPYLSIPGMNGKVGSEVDVVQDVGGRKLKWKGQVARLLPDLDPAGRMARVLIEIEDPLGRKRTDGDDAPAMPLLIDSYVQVEVVGQREEALIAVPRNGIREGTSVYVFRDGKLEIRKVEIAWRRKNDVLVRGGLETGDQVITTRIPAPVEGLKVRTKKSAPAKPDKLAEKASR